jgi:hypothetical protein
MPAHESLCATVMPIAEDCPAMVETQV